MKTRTKILSVLVALLPAVLATVAVQLESPREMIQFDASDPMDKASVTFLTTDVIRPDRGLARAVRYELGLTESVRKPSARQRARSWYLPERPTNTLEPFGK